MILVCSCSCFCSLMLAMVSNAEVLLCYHRFCHQTPSQSAISLFVCLHACLSLYLPRRQSGFTYITCIAVYVIVSHFLWLVNVRSNLVAAMLLQCNVVDFLVNNIVTPHFPLSPISLCLFEQFVINTDNLQIEKLFLY